MKRREAKERTRREPTGCIICETSGPAAFGPYLNFPTDSFQLLRFRIWLIRPPRPITARALIGPSSQSRPTAGLLRSFPPPLLFYLPPIPTPISRARLHHRPPRLHVTPCRHFLSSNAT